MADQAAITPTRTAGRWSVALGLVAAGAVAGAAAQVRTGGLTDLAPYRYGGRAVLESLPLYDARDPVSGLPFTYPPFGAVAMVPLALVPAVLAAALVTAVGIAALVGAVRLALPRAAPTTLACALVVGSLALEPVWQNVRFGQVNLVLMALVLADVTRPDRRHSGVLVGLAAGVKLTPLVFVVLLLVVGRRRASLRAAVTFAVTVAVGYAVMPRQAATYWSDRLVDGARVGPPELAHNQSAYGALSRLLGESPSTSVWLLLAAPVAVGFLVVAAAWWRRGDRVLGAGLAALGMLVASPVSWSHHWVWAVPLGIAVWRRSPWVATAWTAVFAARPILWSPWGEGRERDWTPLQHVVGNAYLLAACGLAVWAAVALRHHVPPTVRGGPTVGGVSDEDIQARIKGLIEQEHDLRQKLGAGEITSEVEHAELANIEVELDQCWDLLRQRRARREFGQDPEEASVRDAGTVENYRG